MEWYCFMQIINRLKNNFHFRFHVSGLYDLGNLGRDLIVRKLVVKFLDIVLLALMSAII